MSTDPAIPTGAPLAGADLERLDARQRMVVTAAKLLQRQGYHATGLKQVVTEAAAPRGSIYHHFPDGKEQLAVEALAVAAAQLTRAIRRAAEATDGPAALVRGLGRALGRWLLDSDFHEGCPVSTVVLETVPSSPALTAACAAAYAEWSGLLAGRLVAAGLGEAEAATLGTTILAAIEGGLLLARAEQDIVPLDSVVGTLVELIEGRVAAA